MSEIQSILIGRTIELVKMVGLGQELVSPGTKGVVTSIVPIDDFYAHIYVDWETNQTTPITSPVDEFNVIN